MSLQDRMDEFKKNFETQAPEEALEVMHRTTEQLKESGIAEHAVKPGDQAPGFALKDTEGNTVTLNGLLARGPVVLGFYRGKW